MALRPEVIQRLLLAKSILGPYRFAPWGEPDDYDVALQVLASHDAADLVFAAIADHQGKFGNKGSKRSPSMTEALGLVDCEKTFSKPTTYFSQLNEARDSLKHRGILPNAKQWGRAGQSAYEKLSEVCRVCISFSLDEIDESTLLHNKDVRGYFNQAKDAVGMKQYKKALEEIGKALCILLDENHAVGDIRVGEAKAEHAIKLSGFGVHANEFLRLQEFLPEVSHFGEDPFRITWKQSEFGHPGNWREDVAQFCVEAFLNIAPRIQDAKWIPQAIELSYFYKYKVTAKEETVEIWEEVHQIMDLHGESVTTKREIGQLHKGEPRTFNATHQPIVLTWYDEVEARSYKVVKLQDNFVYSALFPGPSQFVLFDKVTITCVPTGLMGEHFPDLVEIPWEPDDESAEEQS